MPYFNVLLAHMGYGARQIGVISILRPLVSGVSGPLLSSTADALSAHRKMFLIALALTSMVRALAPWNAAGLLLWGSSHIQSITPSVIRKT